MKRVTHLPFCILHSLKCVSAYLRLSNRFPTQKLSTLTIQSNSVMETISLMERLLPYSLARDRAEALSEQQIKQEG